MSFAEDINCSFMIGCHLLPAATKLGQGNVFTGVCHSVNGGGSAPGGCLVPGGMVPGGGAWWRPPRGRPLLRAVRILLECIFVFKILFMF